MSDRVALASLLTLEAEQHPRYPYAHDLLRIATVRLGAPFMLPPRLAAAGTLPTIRVRSAKDCAAFTPLPQNPFGIQIVGDVTCEMTCKEVRVSIRAKISHGGRSEAAAGAAARAIGSCKSQGIAVRDGIEAISQRLAKGYIDSVEKDLPAKLTNPDNDARIDALARYLLIGGKDPTYRNALAAALNVPAQWPGFFWNPSPKPARQGCDIIKLVEKDGDASASNGNYVEAAATFAAVAHCGPELRRKAFLHACNAGDHAKAKAMYPQLPAADAKVLLPTCTAQGIDPTKP